MKIIITNWKSYQKNTLCGFMDITITDIGLEIQGVSYHMKPDGKKWLALPSKTYQIDGKTKYKPVLSFPNTDDYWAFCGACFDAVKVWKDARGNGGD